MTSEAFSILRLHAHSPQSWAVIRRPGGAIAEDDDGKLLMRLTREEAEERAATLNAASLVAAARCVSAVALGGE